MGPVNVDNSAQRNQDLEARINEAQGQLEDRIYRRVEVGLARFSKIACLFSFAGLSMVSHCFVTSMGCNDSVSMVGWDFIKVGTAAAAIGLIAQSIFNRDPV